MMDNKQWSNMVEEIYDAGEFAQLGGKWETTAKVIRIGRLMDILRRYLRQDEK